MMVRGLETVLEQQEELEQLNSVLEQGLRIGKYSSADAKRGKDALDSDRPTRITGPADFAARVLEELENDGEAAPASFQTLISSSVRWGRGSEWGRGGDGRGRGIAVILPVLLR